MEYITFEDKNVMKDKVNLNTIKIFGIDGLFTLDKIEKLVERAIKNSCPKKGVVYDPFGGSGSTLIACEKNNKSCFMMELDPAYCDVIVQRWEDYTGKKAILMESANA